MTFQESLEVLHRLKLIDTMGLSSYGFDTRTQVLTIEYDLSFCRWLCRKPAKVGHYRLENGEWYDALSFKKIGISLSYRLYELHSFLNLKRS